MKAVLFRATGMVGQGSCANVSSTPVSSMFSQSLAIPSASSTHR